MSWARVDDSFYLHPKVAEAGNAAVGAWIRALSYCAAHHTGGFVPQEVAAMLSTKRERDKLVAVGMWQTITKGVRITVTGRKGSGRRSLEDATVTAPANGYFIADFLLYHPTRDEVETLRDHRASAAQVRNQGRASAHQSDSQKVRTNPEPSPIPNTTTSSQYEDVAEIETLLTVLDDKDEGTRGVIQAIVHEGRLTERDIGAAIEAARSPATRSRTARAVDELMRRAQVRVA